MWLSDWLFPYFLLFYQIFYNEKYILQWNIFKLTFFFFLILASPFLFILSLFFIHKLEYQLRVWFLNSTKPAFKLYLKSLSTGLPRGTSGKEVTCQCRRPKRRVQSLSWKNPWRRKWQPTPVFLPGESSWTEEPGG